MKKILITGATGFIGNDISKKIYEKFQNYKITIIGRKIKSWNSKIIKKNIKYFDLNKDNLKKLGSYDYIIHCAALLDNHGRKYSWEEYYEYNVKSIFRILNKINFKRLVYLSSGSVFSSNVFHPNPNNYYGLSKYVSEKLLEIHSFISTKEIIITRLPIVVGMNSKNNIVDDLAKKIIKNNKVEIYGTGKFKRNILHIDEAVELITKLCFKKKFKNKFNIYNLGSSNSMNIIDIALLVKKITNSKSRFIKIKNIRRANYDVMINLNKIKKIINYKAITTRKSIIKLVKQKYL